MNKLFIRYLPISELKIDPRNARTHSEKQIGQIAKSIERFGFNTPILVDNDSTIIAGHGRLLAAQRLGIAIVPTVRLEHLDARQRRAYALADNRLAELASWDRKILASEFQGLLEVDLEFEITDVGFEMAEIDLILDDARDLGQSESEDELPEISEAARQSRTGDLWQLGEHLLFCGDALDLYTYIALMGRDRADVVFADPPYNVHVPGHVSGLGRGAHREFLQASGEMSNEQYRDFLRNACKRMRDFSIDGSIHYVCMDWRHIDALIDMGRSVFSEFKNLCVWVKPNGGMGSFYRSRHELVAVFKAGTASHRNNVQLGAHGRYRTNVWEYDGMSGFQSRREEKLAMHPTVKPVGLIADAILDCSARGDLVLDPFAGSGSSLLAAERCGRRCRAIELDPIYVDVALARFAKATGKIPVNLWTGQEFEFDIDDRRAGPIEHMGEEANG